MSDNMDDLLAELDIDGLDDIDDITPESAKKMVKNMHIDSSRKDDNIVTKDSSDITAFFTDEEVDDLGDVDDIDLEDVDALLKKAFNDDAINEENIDGAIDEALLGTDVGEVVSKKNAKEDTKENNDEEDEVIQYNSEKIDSHKEKKIEPSEQINIKEVKRLAKEQVKEAKRIAKAKKAEKAVPLKERVKDLSNKLFTNIEDKAYDEKIHNEEERVANEKIRKAEKKVKRAEEKKLEDAEKKAAKAEEKEKKKAQATAKKKKTAAQKKQAKEKRKAELEEELKNEPIGRINKLGAVVVFAFVGIILLMIILTANFTRSRIDFAKEAEILMNKGNYEMAYINLLKDPELNKESKLYKKLNTIQSLNKQLSYYNSYISLHKREEALDALIVGVEKYDTYLTDAIHLGIEKEYREVHKQIQIKLKEEFEISVQDARKIRNTVSDEEYSEKIALVCEESRK